ncbi:hypothetical protein BKA65DRAFT_600261 [Rhexocercosporidium sp. MPI-PUGE-AT-0058]|nr:hypothetical protein BKA65DRAFT_600261 [Rhexocercosporidium sp. MPI-PUGE-AT-0058]
MAFVYRAMAPATPPPLAISRTINSVSATFTLKPPAYTSSYTPGGLDSALPASIATISNPPVSTSSPPMTPASISLSPITITSNTPFLPSPISGLADPSICIRFDPEDTQNFIRNAQELVDLPWHYIPGPSRMISGPRKLCTKSYLGENITSLMVHAKHFWGTNGDGGFDDDAWKLFFEPLFKDLEAFVAGFIDDDGTNYLFPDYHDGFYNNSDDEEEFSSDSDDSVKALEWKREHGGLALEREEFCDSPADVEDLDWLTEMIGDFLAEVTDAIKEEDPTHFEEYYRPFLYVHDGGDSGGGSVDRNRELNLEELEIRDPDLRTDFEVWGQRWNLGYDD